MILSKVSIGIAYESDIHKASELMVQAAKKCEGVLEKPAPFVLFKEHAASTLNFDIYFAINVRNKMERWKYESEVNYHLDDTLRAAGIVIAFAQIDVHFDTSKPADPRTAKSEKQSGINPIDPESHTQGKSHG